MLLGRSGNDTFYYDNTLGDTGLPSGDALIANGVG
jgi:hypothetical protein